MPLFSSYPTHFITLYSSYLPFFIPLSSLPCCLSFPSYLTLFIPFNSYFLLCIPATLLSLISLSFLPLCFPYVFLTLFHTLFSLFIPTCALHWSIYRPPSYFLFLSLLLFFLSLISPLHLLFSNISLFSYLTLLSLYSFTYISLFFTLLILLTSLSLPLTLIFLPISSLCFFFSPPPRYNRILLIQNQWQQCLIKTMITFRSMATQGYYSVILS